MNTGNSRYPRAKVIGVLQSGDRILVEEYSGRHSKGIGTYYRPIGGSIEFGEISSDALIREFYEEIRAMVEIEKYIGCIENLFNIKEQMGHEILQVYKVKFVEKSNYNKEIFEIQEEEQSSFAKWIDITDFINGNKILYPDNLIYTLRRGIS